MNSTIKKENYLLNDIYSPETKELIKYYQESKIKEKLLPSIENFYVLKKIKALEELFKIEGVESLLSNTKLEVYNESPESAYFLPNIQITNNYNIERNFELIELLEKYSHALVVLKQVDDEIDNYLIESNESSSIDNIHIEIEDYFPLFFKNRHLTKENRFEQYKEMALSSFSEELEPFFIDFIDSLKNNTPFQKEVKNIYGFDIDCFSTSEDDFSKITQSELNRNEFLFQYCQNIILDNIVDNILNDNKRHLIFTFFDSENYISVSYDNINKHFLSLDLDMSMENPNLKNISIKVIDRLCRLCPEKKENITEIANNFLCRIENETLKKRLTKNQYNSKNTKRL